MRRTFAKWATLTPVLLMVVPALMGMRGCDEPVPIGGTCEPTDCGPALGAPAYTCADGSIGGNTGRCVTAGTECGWELRDCPPAPTCADDECGPAPRSPYSSRCERTTAGICRWVIEEPAKCEPAECGAVSTASSFLCEDGTIGGFTGHCQRRLDGTCGWEIIECPPSEECDLSACGAPSALPADLCDDGSIGGNTGRCGRGVDGDCGWELRPCPTGVVCGGFSPVQVDCGPDAFCAWSEGDLCGAADATGICTRIPTAGECAAYDTPVVCGCNGVTYDNECYAWLAGQSVSSTGDCSRVRCHPGLTLCGREPPTCAAGEVPAMNPAGDCWTGACVQLAQCSPMACAIDEDCPSTASTPLACRSGQCEAR